MAISIKPNLHTPYVCKAINEITPHTKENTIKIPKNIELNIFSHGEQTKVRWKDKKKTHNIIIKEEIYSFLKKIKPFQK